MGPYTLLGDVCYHVVLLPSLAFILSGDYSLALFMQYVILQLSERQIESFNTGEA